MMRMASAMRRGPMRWRLMWWGLLGGLLALGMGCTGGSEETSPAEIEAEQAPPPRATPAAGRPNVLLLMLDTLRTDRTGLLTEGLTPALMRFGAGGVGYTQAISPSSWTMPAIAGIHGGTRVVHNRHGPFEDRPVLAEHFSQAGYATAAFVGNPLLKADDGYARGFDIYENAALRSRARDQSAEVMLGRARQWLGEAEEGQSVFLSVHVMDPHFDYEDRFAESAPPVDGWSTGLQLPWLTEPSEQQTGCLERWRRAYDGQIAAMDTELGRFLDELETLRPGPWVVAITADHGEGLFDHVLPENRDPHRHRPLASLAGCNEALKPGYGDHGQLRIEQGIRVPLWLVGPGVPAGRTEQRQVELADLAGTLLGLAGLPHGALGQLPMTDQDPHSELVLGVDKGGLFARSEEWKLLLNDRRKLAALPAVQLFAMEGPRFAPELEELSAQHPEVVQQLQEALDAALGAQLPEGEVDQATRERLEAMGYVQ